MDRPGQPAPRSNRPPERRRRGVPPAGPKARTWRPFSNRAGATRPAADRREPAVRGPAGAASGLAGHNGTYELCATWAVIEKLRSLVAKTNPSRIQDPASFYDAP